MANADQRGSYPKGVTRRAQILQAALDVYADDSGREPSLRRIAAKVGLTEAGVLHYFESKDDLLVAVLAARDAAMGQQFDLTTKDGAWSALEHTYDTPGLVKLFVDMTVAAASPAHPAHEFMKRRARGLFHLLDGLLDARPGGDEWTARVLVAAAEGLQIQWLRDPSTDVVADLRRLFDALNT